MATIDNLSIQVTANADSAASALNRLASSASVLRGAAAKAGGGMRDLAAGAKDAGTETKEAGTQSGNATPKIRGVGNEAKKAGDNAKKGASGLATFWQSLKRIAFYRFIRSIIKEITEAFKEGITNLYHWSAAVNGTFAKSMDRIATSTLYLKNSLGAMLAPLINALAPVIEWVIDRIVDVINWINKLFAALTGAQTYTVAKKVATTWADAGKTAAGSAKKAADDIKRTILGFDEINKLEKQNTSSGGGGSGSTNNGPDYSNMFEEKPLDGWMKSLSDFINKVKGWMDPIKNWFDELGNKVKNVWDGFIDGAKDFFSDPLDWLKTNVGDPITNGLRKLFGINSPSTEMIIVGTYLMQGLKEGMLEELAGIDEWLKNNIVKPIKDAFSDNSTILYFSPKLDNRAKVLYDNFKKDWNDIESRTVYVSPKLDNTGKVLFNGLKKEWDDITSRTLFVSVAISQTAKYLFDTLKKNWNKVTGKTLYVNVAISQSAKYLYDALENNWKEITNKTLYVNAAISQSAKYLYDALERNWKGIISKTLYVNAAISQSALSLYNALKKNWDDIVSKTLYFNVAISQSALLLYNGLKDAWSNLTNRTLYVNVSITQSAQLIYDTLRGNWNSLTSRTLYVNVLISQSAQYLFDALKGKWNSLTSRTLYVNVAISQSAQKLYDGFKSNWDKLTNKTVEIDVTLHKKDWNTVTDFVDGQFDGTSGGGGKTSGGGAGRDRQYKVNVSLEKSDSTTIQSLLGLQNNAVSIVVDAVGAWADTIGGILPYLGVNDLSSFVWMDTVTSWASTAGGILSWLNVTNLSSDILMDLTKDWGTQTPQSYLGLDNLSTTIKAKLKVDNKANKATIKISASNAGSLLELTQDTKALGGIFSGGAWRNIPQYAGGTTNAGSLFLAGEAGPELVGHVGGRTEVLNKSQLASAMYSAVQSAMAPASANFAAAANGLNSDDGYSFDDIEDMIYAAVDRAMSQRDSRENERNRLLERIEAKEYTAEISTASINRAQTRMNRRAGATLVPVG